MKVRVLWNKDPFLHKFYVDTEKNSFFKCYSIDGKGQELYRRELDSYTKLQGASFIPKLKSAGDEVNCDHSYLELEYNEYPPLIGHAGEYYRKPVPTTPLTKKQVTLIKQKLAAAKFLMEKRNFIENNEVKIEGAVHHTIFNPETNQLKLIDLSYNSPVNISFMDAIVSHVVANPVVPIKVAIKDILFVKHDTNKLTSLQADSIYQLGQDILAELRAQPWGFIQSSVYINDSFFIGHRDTFENRNKAMKIKADELVGKTVLDIGCNIGGGLQYFAERGASKVIGVDTTCAALLPKFTGYLRRIHPIYANIDTYPGDIRTVIHNPAIPDIDVCFYLSVLAYCGNPEFHAKLGNKCKVIYLEGHSDDATSGKAAKAMEQIGPKWSWELLGHTDNQWDDRDTYKPRPVYKGVKHG